MDDRLVAETRWLSLRERSFGTRDGQAKVWSYVTRPNSRGGVCIIAQTPAHPREVLIIRQFRPAIGANVLEFPAGLIDAHESPAEAALRELREETGFTGRVCQVGPLALSSPGMTDEGNHVVIVELGEQVEATPEEDETIEVLRWPLAELFSRLQAAAAQGESVDAKLWAYALGRVDA